MIVVIAKDMADLPEGKYVNDGQVSGASVSDFLERAFDTVKIYAMKDIKSKFLPLSDRQRKQLAVDGRFIKADREVVRDVLRECDYEDVIVFICDGLKCVQYRKENKQLKLW